MKKTFRNLFMAVLCLLMVLPVILADTTSVQAATVRMSRTSVTLEAGKKTTIKVKGTRKKPTWKSSNVKVAIVSASGKITALKKGRVTITAKVGKKTYKCKVTVTPNYTKLYEKYLAAHRNDLKWYYIINVDKKGAPEMVATYGGGGITSYDVFTISSGKVVKVGSYAVRGIGMSNPTFHYVAKRKCLLAEGWINTIGGSWSRLMTVSGTKLVNKYYLREEHGYSDSYYIGTSDENAVATTKAKYLQYYNDNVKGWQAIYLKKNTF